MQKTKFRLYSKKIFLTYSQINKDINLDIQDIQIKKNILKQLEEKIEKRNTKIEEYVLSLEHHLDGNKHIHVFLEFFKRVDIRNHTFFDISINENKNIHGNYQVGKNKFSIISYIIKTYNDYISNKKYSVKDGLLLRPLEHILDILKKDGLDEALKVLIKQYPEIAILKIGL